MLDHVHYPSAIQGTVDATITVFFDGQCPMCRREIDYYRRLDSLAPIQWIDIADDRIDTEHYGLNRNLAMIRFHVLDGDGQWHTGAWGFAALWRRLPGWRWLARLLTHARLLPLTDRLYARITLWRLNKKCTSQTCGT